MTDLQRRILAAMPKDFVVTVQSIADETGATLQATQAALHELDDAGMVLMRSGLYRLSAVAVAARKRLEGADKA